VARHPGSIDTDATNPMLGTPDPTMTAGARPTASPLPGRWSPLHAPGARLSWGLLAVFTLIYFVTAVLTSADFAELAALSVLGMPLGFVLGIGLILAGLVVTRVYLSRVAD
jgi:uncharacterized membrane protein (DUF485 family)